MLYFGYHTPRQRWWMELGCPGHSGGHDWFDRFDTWSKGWTVYSVRFPVYSMRVMSVRYRAKNATLSGQDAPRKQLSPRPLDIASNDKQSGAIKRATSKSLFPWYGCLAGVDDYFGLLHRWQDLHHRQHYNHASRKHADGASNSGGLVWASPWS